ncbi:ABC transporter permease [Philodulcilactobacillus myokoensis]|uniref:ABC transporter permease n=1 Tax=Philodulcilactobacillus myokoensis TaxID=2929573 RepID=A0A9W6AZ08_9LACO|nr:ABC transporter permease [Philodulcilactobacillus myokoensis]GLB46046.1 ABC transporter permease [Philodulcilactobacillus myokoensis]
MRKMWIVTFETYIRQVKTWSFALMVLMPFILALVSGGIGFLTAQNSSSDASNDSSDQVAIISSQPSLRQSLIKQHRDDIDAKVTNEKTAQSKTKSQDLDGYVVLNVKNNRITATYHGQDQIDSDIKSDLMGSINQIQHQLNLKNAHLSINQINQLNAQPTFKSILNKHPKASKTSQSEDQSGAKEFAFFIIIFITYMILLTYASVMAQSVAEEKGAKVIEVIFSSTTAAKYFLGKVFGIMGCVITQFLIYIIGGGIIYQFISRIHMVHQFLSNAENQRMISLILHDVLSPGLLFVILGIGLYLIISALCGALVSKASDSAKAAQPVVFIVLAFFIIAINFQSSSNTMIPKVLSYVPFSSMFFMPIRMINGHVTSIEITISLAILLATLIILTWLITKIYRSLMLQNDDSGFFRRLKHGIQDAK